MGRGPRGCESKDFALEASGAVRRRENVAASIEFGVAYSVCMKYYELWNGLVFMVPQVAYLT